MLIGTYSGFNAHIGHPLSRIFRRDPSWVPAFDLPISEYVKIIDDPDRKHPVWPFAVFDTPEQVFEKWPWIEADPNLYVVSITVLRKEEQEPSGGWRWHKWGDYLGDLEPQCEYLYDEPEIAQATVAHVYEIDEDAHSHARLQALAFMEETAGGNYEGF